MWFAFECAILLLYADVVTYVSKIWVRAQNLYTLLYLVLQQHLRNCVSLTHERIVKIRYKIAAQSKIFSNSTTDYAAVWSLYSQTHNILPVFTRTHTLICFAFVAFNTEIVVSFKRQSNRALWVLLPQQPLTFARLFISFPKNWSISNCLNWKLCMCVFGKVWVLLQRYAYCVDWVNKFHPARRSTPPVKREMYIWTQPIWQNMA